VDREPRPRVQPKKRRRDRLIGLAEHEPGWAVGFEDEAWWSRLSSLAFRGWSEAGKRASQIHTFSHLPKTKDQRKLIELEHLVLNGTLAEHEGVFRFA
jgi:hypothetical protein